ncbi:MAG: hypothetical protein CMK00_06540 [Planctomycetes bacterium]|nr:hypothetical protein [Planctomycetota bacterium]
MRRSEFLAGSAAALLLLMGAGCSHQAEELHGEVSRLETELEGHQRIIVALRQDLEVQEEAHRKREEEWLSYTRALASLPVPDVPSPPGFIPVKEDEGAAPARSSEELALEEELRRVRVLDEEVCTQLGVLLRAEQVSGYRFLTVGSPGEGFAGPVVVRLSDQRGRPLGSLHAERFHLEASHAGKSVTMVFEEGGESHGGRPEVPFEGGRRRVPLLGVAPEPWLEALPGLFPEDERTGPRAQADEKLARRAKALNELLLEDTSDGYWRLKDCASLDGRIFREVQLEHRGRDGKLDKRLFTDQLSVQAGEQDASSGVILRLSEGVQDVRGELRPFLQGRFSIFLPGADAGAWRGAGLLR